MLRCAIPIEIAGQASRCGVSAAPVASGSPWPAAFAEDAADRAVADPADATIAIAPP